MTDAQDFRADDLSALNNLIVSASRFGGSNGAIANPYTSLGSARDPLSHSQIVPTRELTPRECIDLYEGDRLFRVLVDALPLRSPAPIWTFGSHEDNDDEINSDDVTKYLDRAARNGNNYAMSSTQQALGQVANSQDLYQFLNPDSGFMNLFRSCAQDARMFKTSYILIGVDDGMDWEEPLNWEGIRSLRWLKHLSFNEIIPKDNPSDPEFYEVKVKQGEGTEGSNRNKRLVHQSRVVRLLGHPLPLAAAQIKSCPATSVIQSFYPAYSRLIQCLQSATNMVASHSAFTSGIQGLGEMTKTPEGRQKLFNRLESMMMSMSSLRGIMYDTNGEKVDYINRQYAGIKDIIDIQLDYVTAQSDTPRFLLFGTSNRSGLGAEGRGEQESLQFAQAMRTWVNTHLRDPMLYLGTIALLAEDFPEGNGILPEGFNVEFPSILELDPLSIAKILVEYTEAYTKATEAGFVDKTEVRRSLFEPASLPLSGTIDLDDRISEMMEEALEGTIEGDDEDEDIEDDEEDLEEGDRAAEEESEDIEGEAIDPDGEEDGGDRSDCIDIRADAKLSDLKRNGNGQVWYRGRWWTPNKPVPSDRAGKKRMVLATKDGQVKVVHFGAKGYGHNYSSSARKSYLARSAGIKGKNGRSTASDKFSPNYWARKVLWAGKGGSKQSPPKRSDSPDIDQRFDIIEKTKSGKFILWNTDRTKVLGTHSSYEEALAQERAIEISKHQKKDESHETTDDSGISEKNDSEGDIRFDVIFTDKALHQQAKAWAKRTFAVYPSAYANGAMVKKYRELYRRKHKTTSGAFRSDADDSVFEDDFDGWLDFGDRLIHIEDIDELFPGINDDEHQVFDESDRQDDLDKWFNKEKWVRLTSTGLIGGPCAREPGEAKPKCVPLAKARSMSKAERIAAVRRKRREDPNPDRQGKPIHVSTHGKKDEQDTENRSDALRLTELPQVGSRVKYRGRLYLPNRPYKKGDRLIVLATRGSFVKLVEFGADDVDTSNDFNSHQSQFWANLYYSFGQPPIETTEEPETATDDRTDVESIEVSGDILEESEFEELGAIDLLQTLENIFEEE